jgi:RES domain
MTLYRVFPFVANARPSEPGGALFTPYGGAGRIANPNLYNELYLSSTAAGALSEAFGRLDTWTDAIFAQPDRPYALATYELSDHATICDLDNAGRLLAYELRPSDVVARDRSITQTWAALIYRSKKWNGIAWWSRYDSRWRSLGVWNRKQLRLKRNPEPLSLEHAAVQEAAMLLPRRLEPA